MTARRFLQVDVFGGAPLGGNPVAVVLDADGLAADTMQDLARWTNLSETTFVLAPTDPTADYRVRIFTPTGELPFAGHPTLGTAHAWLVGGGAPEGERIVQECGIGAVPLRRLGDQLAFAAPPTRIEEVGPEAVVAVAGALGIEAVQVTAARLLDNGVPWLTLLLQDAATVLALEPDPTALRAHPFVGVVGLRPPGGGTAIEVRGLAAGAGAPEDPVTGSLNAAVAVWLTGEGALPSSYVAAQGAAIGRTGRVHVTVDAEATWIGGTTTTVIEGTVELSYPEARARQRAL